MANKLCLYPNRNIWCSVKANQSSLSLSILTMPSIKALIRNECSAQNAMHNGMTPQDAGHVILNLFNLWEPCTELTFESLESPAKQDHSAPHRVRNRRACTCRSLFSTLLLEGLHVSVFPPHSPADLSLGGELGISSIPLSSPAKTCRAVLLMLPRLRQRVPYTPQGLYFIDHLNPTRLLTFFNADHQGTGEVGFPWMLLHLGEPGVL